MRRFCVLKEGRKRFITCITVSCLKLTVDLAVDDYHPKQTEVRHGFFQSQETDGTRDVEPSGVEAKVFPRSLASTNRPQDVLNLDSKYSCLRRSFSDMNMILAWKRVMLGNKMRRNINQFETCLWFASLGLGDFKLLTLEFQESLLV